MGLITLGAPPGATSRALALLLWLAAAAMLVSAIGAASGKLVPAAVLATTALPVGGAVVARPGAAWHSVAR